MCFFMTDRSYCHQVVLRTSGREFFDLRVARKKSRISCATVPALIARQLLCIRINHVTQSFQVDHCHANRLQIDGQSCAFVVTPRAVPRFDGSRSQQGKEGRFSQRTKPEKLGLTHPWHQGKKAKLANFRRRMRLHSRSSGHNEFDQIVKITARGIGAAAVWQVDVRREDSGSDRVLGPDEM